MNVEYGKKFMLNHGDETNIPPDAPVPQVKEVYKMGALDGMYCYCFDSYGTRFYMASWTEVSLVE